VSFVGGGGKTAALKALACEVAEAGPGGRRVLATTTTAMLLSQLQEIGPVLLKLEQAELLAGVKALFGGAPTAGAGPPSGCEAPPATLFAAAARGVREDGKVEGLPLEWVDRLWRAGVVDQLLVEADGSRGRSLKAFASHEPQPPAATTVIVQVAGLDVLEAPLAESNVHRAALLATSLGVDIGVPLTVSLFIAALRAQLRVLRDRRPAARIVTILNKAEDLQTRAAGLQFAEVLMAGGPADPKPERVVVGSVQRGRFTVCLPAAPLVTAVVLAAGASTRMGDQKLLLPVHGVPMIRLVVEAATHSGVAETVAVVGADAEAVRSELGVGSFRVVENDRFASGMSTSLQAGLAAARPDCDAVVFVLGDQPFVSAGLIDILVARFREKGLPIVRPVVQGRQAHPVLMAAEMFPEILALEGDVGAREIVARHPEKVDLVEFGDPRPVGDIDTPEDYVAAQDT
jgi:molybdenum cofactor cytidylyltransferase